MRARTYTYHRQESQTGEIHLPDDEPSAIMRMLAFLYTGEYDDDDESKSLLSVNSIHSTALTNLSAAEAQNNDKDHFVKRMINQAAVYGIADKYDIQDLKTLAHRSFILLGCGIIPEKFMDLSEVVDTVYNSTPASDRNLRDIVVSICKYRTEFHLAQASFQEMSQRNAQFSFDLLCAVQKDVVKAKAEWTADAQKMRKTIDDLRAEESKLQREIVNQGKLMNRVQDLVDFGYALPAGFLDFDD